MIMLTSPHSEWGTNAIHFVNINLIKQPSVAALSLPSPPNALPPKTQIPQVSRGVPVAKVDKEDKEGSYELPILCQKDEC